MTKWEEFARDFPEAVAAIEERFGAGIPQPADLRDHFAAAALHTQYAQCDTDPNKTACWAYQIADAMLKAREQ